QTIGERFIKTRQGSGLTLLNVAREIGIKERYLAAIEAGQYNELPGDIYALEFVKTYARFLHLNEREALREYVAERQVIIASRLRENRRARIKRIVHWLSRQHLFFGKLALGALVFGFIVYVSSWVRIAKAGPKLEVFSPTAYYEATGSLVVLAGQTSPSSDIFINNEEIFVDDRGAFNEAINVLPGVTLLKIVAQDGQGRRQTVYRTIRSLGGQVAGASIIRGEEEKNN
ncbi:MAG: helix-turn-helix domain-containing protein, partial [Candidatus Komeilibacteria bacterium]|nr:helix-turn-helix domain-containing protein [Candidatus Komeilibacteria bacterium]